MSGKQSLLRKMMNEVKDCRLCCDEGQGISADRLLRNFIAERPDGPRYGGVPHMCTDWAARLDAKIAIIYQDWGPYSGAIFRRDPYERAVTSAPAKRQEIWRHMVQNDPRGPSRSDASLRYFLQQSAKREGLDLPASFMDRLFLTNAVLCLRQGRSNTGNAGIDLEKSFANCCFKNKFLRRQLEIVKPAVVVTLGAWALWGLAQTGGRNSLGSIVEGVRHASPYGYTLADYYGLSLVVVPVFHPSARPVSRSEEQQIEDYRFIWRTLPHIVGLSGDELIEACFPSARA